MRKTLSLMILCVILSAAALSFAEQWANQAVFDDFSVIAGKVTRSGDKFVIHLSAVLQLSVEPCNTDTGGTIFRVTPKDEVGWDLPAEGIEESATVERAAIWPFERNICFVSLKTLDGEPFMDNTRDWEFRIQEDSIQQSNGTLRCDLTFTTHSLFANEGGVVVQFHVFDGTSPYIGEAQQKLYIPLP